MRRRAVWARSSRFRFVSWSLISAVIACAVQAQDYPRKPVRIVTSGAGGLSDFVIRLVANEMTAAWGRQVVIDNKASAVAIESAAHALPDGYTLSYFGSTMWLAPFLRRAMRVDPLRDFVPVSLAVSTPALLVVNPALPVKSVEELIALARSRPGEINYGAPSAGSTPHLGAEYFNKLARVSLYGIQYKGIAAAMNAVMSNEVQVMVVTSGSVASQLNAGKLRAIAVTSKGASQFAPELPTIASSVPGYELVSIWGMFAPAKTPDALIRRVHREIVRALEKQGIRERLVESGVEAVGSTPEQFRDAVKADMAQWGKLITELGIRPD